jgi:sugar lactone lactonase YvrE
VAQITASSILSPTGLAYDASGNLYFADADRHQIFESTLAGQLLVIAGTGTQGYSGDGAVATAAQLNAPQAIAIAADGTMYIADTGNNVIRVVSNGAISTIAGTGKAAFSGDNGPATAAALASPNALAIDITGALLIADSGNHRIRRVANGIITTVAGNGTQGFFGDSGPATAAQLDTPSGIATAPDGRIFIADTHNHRIRVVDNTGTISTFAGIGRPGFFGDNALATAAQFDSPRGLALTASGVLLVADTNDQRVRSISQQGIVSTLAGGATQGSTPDATAALTASLNTPRALAVSSFGYVTLSDSPNHAVRILAADNNLYLPAALTKRLSAITLAVGSNAIITVAGSAATPQGSVQLFVDAVPTLTATLASGTATLSLSTLTAGSHTLTASYLGDGLNPAASSSAITLSTAKATTAVITQPPTANDYAGLPLLLNANVTSAAKGNPTGTVNFMEGTTAVATAQVVAGIASGVFLAPAAGTHIIAATYTGDSNFLPGTAPSVIAVIKPMPDFTVISTTATQTIAAGAIAIYSLSITPQSGPFTGAVSLSATGLPYGATVSFAPPQVVPGASSATTIMSVQTLASTVQQRFHTTFVYALLALPLLLIRRRTRRTLLIFGLLALAGCGTRINQPPTKAAGSYTLTVNATGTNLAGAIVVHTTTVALTIE